MNFSDLLADRTKRMRANAIREILKVVSQPGVISLAGGIPAPESFPMEIMRELTDRVCTGYASRALQYDLSEGFIPLREALCGYLKEMGIITTADNIIVSNGSQGILDAVGKILITKGDCIAVESPTYLGAISAFNPYEPEYVGLETDDDGVIPDSLDSILKTRKIKFTYLVPTFQNPTGRTITLERRRKIAEIARNHNAVIVEDDPYSALRYKGERIPPIKVFAPDHVVYVGTLSKVFAPGLRIGFCDAPQLIRKWMVLAKQGIDLHTSTFNQALAAEYINGGYLKEQLTKIIKLYKPKQEAMLEALSRYFPRDFRWSKPDGGMFIWVEGPKGMDMEKLYWRAIERKVAFVPGRFFYCQEDEGHETMRLNYTMNDESTIDKAVKTLSELAFEFMQNSVRQSPDALYL